MPLGTSSCQYERHDALLIGWLPMSQWEARETYIFREDTSRERHTRDG